MSAAASASTMRGPLYRMVWWSLQLIDRTWFRVRVEGQHHVPRTGGVILASNHQSFADPLLLGGSIWRRIHFLARDTLFSHRVFGAALRQVGAVPVKRGKADRESLHTVVQLARAGDVVCVFPEGTRTLDGSLSPLKKGILLMARMAGVPVVPVGISGMHALWPKDRKFPRSGRVRVAYGAPIPAADFEQPATLELLADALALLARVPRRTGAAEPDEGPAVTPRPRAVLPATRASSSSVPAPAPAVGGRSPSP